MKQSTLSKEEKQRRIEEANRDIAFQEQLESFDKQSLCLLITQLTANSTSREWVLSYVASIEDVYKDSGVIQKPTLRDDLLKAIANERLTDEVNFGPVRMNPRTIDEWLDLIHRNLADADKQAAMGAKLRALNAILSTASQCVAALEDRLGKAIEEGAPALEAVIMEVTDRRPTTDDRPVSDNGKPYNPRNKKTGDAATSPADSVH